MYILHIDYYFLSTSVISSAKSDCLTDAVSLFIKTSKTKIKQADYSFLESHDKLNPKLWGIKNLSGTDWSITDDAGVRKIIPHQGVVPIIKNLQIEFKPQIIGKLK
jgi:hypothetical protein